MASASSQCAMGSLWSLQAPDILEIEAAAARILPKLVRTPLLESERVNRVVGGRLLVKAESLQRTGSFKARGALNFIGQIPQETRAKGVVAYSSGNHAQAVAWSAAQYGIPSLVIMPLTAPAAKVARAEGWGATIRQIDWSSQDARALCNELADEYGMTMVPPFEDRRILAGVGTLGLELMEQAFELSAEHVDAVLANCSGGGLLAGTALAVKARSPDTEIWAVEPEDFDDLARSLRSGKHQANEPGAFSICDALTARTTGELTFSIAKQYVSGGVTVSDQDVLQAMRLAFEEFRIVVEPGGAAALAAVLSGAFDIKGKTVVVLASGSNVDADLYRRSLE